MSYWLEFPSICSRIPHRLCPGRQFGDAAVFLAIANVIATLNINKARDVQGREITPEPRFTSGFTR